MVQQQKVRKLREPSSKKCVRKEAFDAGSYTHPYHSQRRFVDAYSQVRTYYSRKALVMPYKSDAQRRFFHSPGAAKAGITPAEVKEFDTASKGKKLPEKVKAKKNGKSGR